ncbi:Chemotaxis protein CheA [Fundidesulfovibrio magnetotacticus]|uniref:Chemotaxis protein CheA n=1 Tax=Fundidesulfovibrio magnetotacticus TaxID=2730080 RepID=A0A6V8LUD8_9BACT|nr:chemotaxis protein CheA [Fundidesulfovibrio magnetotacticus]GFK93426.1 Chemotaxis protein CheA [Fundidesulfovibrio magnetotacticus]
MNLDAAQLFKEEAAELLADLEHMLLELENDPGNAECIAKVFRDIHTIKGSGAMFGYDELARFAHDVETVFDKVRSGELQLTTELLGLTLEAKDHVGRLLASPKAAPEDVAVSDEILSRLRPYLGQPPARQEAQPGDAQDQPKGHRRFDPSTARTYLLRYQPAPGTFLSGTDPMRLMAELQDLGRLWSVFRPGTIPSLEAMDPVTAYGWWDILIIQDKGIDAIRDVFIFVEDEHGVKIEEIRPEAVRGSDIPTLLDMLQAGAGKSFEALRDEIAGWIAAKVSMRSTAKTAAAPDAGSTASIRVDSARLDALVNLVGEMVIVQSRLSQLAGTSGDSVLRSVAEDLQRLVSEMRDNTLGIRMVPIGSIYGTMRRLVRDLGQSMGKDVAFNGLGAQTELDKNVIDQLKDPLVHILRNSIDHGIEAPEAREAQGKPPKGNITLDAVHSGGNIHITITDDGKGIDTERVKAKAIERGLIAPTDNPTEQEILGMIFAPGFSTAQQVTNVSGRGVGMDVVKKNIESLRGSVDVESTPGKGCRLTIRLPLTLAIIDGLQVRVGSEFFVLPLAAVEACQERFLEGRPPMVGSMEYKGELIPCVSVRGLLDVPGEQPGYERIVVTGVEGKWVGLAVDAVVGQQQAVIKPLSEALGSVRFIAGTTVNGDGGVSVILDVANLIAFAFSRQQQNRAA